jgi:hypothetical protein
MNEDTTQEMDPILKAIAELRAGFEQRFDKIEIRLDGFEKRTTPLATMLEQLVSGQAAIQKDVRELKVFVMETNAANASRISDHEKRLASLEDARLQPS